MMQIRSRLPIMILQAFRPRCAWFAGLLLLASSASPAQTGAYDFGLGGSSVMWLPRPGALFLNPAELGRIREGVFTLNTYRLSTLSSFAAAYFVPSAGTFAAGVSRSGPAHQYSVGYGGTWGRFAGGLGLSGFKDAGESFGISFGGTWHAIGVSVTDGLHAGFSIGNLSDATDSPLFSINAGAAYWVVSGLLRAQGAFQHTGVSDDGLMGVSVQPLGMLALTVGTRSFKAVMGGVSIHLPYVSVDLSLGRAGAFLSVNAALSEPAVVARDRNYELGLLALDENRYQDSERYFRLAHLYDPAFVPAQTAADSVAMTLAEERAELLRKADRLLEAKRYVDASRTYSQVLVMDPDHEYARGRMKQIQIILESYFVELVQAGDSLRARRETEQARRRYQQALDLDPGNDSLITRIAELREMAEENIRAMMSRARTSLNRNQLDEAEREFEAVLAVDRQNNQARQGLATIRSKRTELLFEQGKTQFVDGKNLEALRTFLQVLERSPRHREASQYLERTREALKSEIDTYFRAGLQYYTKDNYQAAIDEWDKVLLIDPNHQGTIEYRKRADEKLKALQRLR